MNLVQKHSERNSLPACYKIKGFVLRKRGLFLKNTFQRNIREQIFKHEGAFYIRGSQKIISVSNIHKSLSRSSGKFFLKVEDLFRIWFQFYKFLDLRSHPVIPQFHPPRFLIQAAVYLFACSQFSSETTQSFPDFLNDPSNQ